MCAVQVRKLPLEGNVNFIGEGKKHPSWKILNVDAVLLALLQFRSTGRWDTALEDAIPERKRRLGQT